MPRVAVGDLLVDLEIPDHLNVGYEESGALVVWDSESLMAIRVSGITVSGKDPDARNLCVASCKDRANEAGLPFFEISPSLGYYEETSNSDWAEGTGVNEFTYAGFGNRTFVFTLSYLESDRDRFDLHASRATARKMVESLSPTHPLAKKEADTILSYELAESQRPWLHHHRTDLARRVHQSLGFEGDPLPLPVLDEYWGRFLSTSEATGGTTTDCVLNGRGVAFADHLIAAKPFEWAVLADSYGVSIGIAAFREKENLTIDPFNFVAKRWDRKETPFLESCFYSICNLVDEHAAKHGIRL